MDERSLTISLRFPADDTIAHGFSVRANGDGLYRIAEIPLLTERVAYGDVVELQLTRDGYYEFVRVVHASAWRTVSFFIERPKATNPEWRDQLDERVTSERGYWQLDFGGLLSIALPPGCGVRAEDLL